MSKQQKQIVYFLFSSILLLVGCRSSNQSIKIGLNTELTGEAPAVGASCVKAATLFVNKINQDGGVDVGGKKKPIELIVADNGSKADEAVVVAQRLITQNEVVAIVGPNISSCAVPASEISENMGCLMISPWSTNIHTTTKNDGAFKKYVFRACFTELVEIPLLAQFAMSHLHLAKAAVLYDMSSESPNSAAHQFQESFLKAGGKIVATETYTSQDRDFSAQLTKIQASHPDILFIPAYYNDVPLIAQQARNLGITAQFLGYNSWSTPEIIQLDSHHYLDHAYFSNHFSTESDNPLVKKFIQSYQSTYGTAPDDIAALTYDTMGLIVESIIQAGSLNRTAIANTMANIEDFTGVTGTYKFHQGNHDPFKNVIILTIENGKFVYVTTLQPE